MDQNYRLKEYKRNLNKNSLIKLKTNVKN